MPEPFAFLWQNGAVLGDGCHQFYPTAERADAEIALYGGWSTPVFASDVDDGFAPKGEHPFHVFDGLDEHEPSTRLDVSRMRAAAILVYMRAEDTGAYQLGHPGREARA